MEALEHESRPKILRSSWRSPCKSLFVCMPPRNLDSHFCALGGLIWYGLGIFCVFGSISYVVICLRGFQAPCFLSLFFIVLSDHLDDFKIIEGDSHGEGASTLPSAHSRTTSTNWELKRSRRPFDFWKFYPCFMEVIKGFHYHKRLLKGKWICYCAIKSRK